jgi:CRISPR-associated endonuclease/helicase Cas3
MDAHRGAPNKSGTEGAAPILERPSEAVAHTPSAGTDDWDSLNQHLTRVSSLAGEFASEFGARDLGCLLGLWHDLGKYNPAWQDYLWDCYRASMNHRRTPKSKVPHAIWGAAYVYSLLGQITSGRWQDLALPILGHHTGLKDAGAASTELVDFHHKNPAGLQIMQAAIGPLLTSLPSELPTVRFPAMELTQRELFIRMLFSALIDADRLDTAAHGNSASVPGNERERLGALWSQFKQHPPKPSQQSATVRRVRNEVYDACLTAATFQPGLFRLRVPTGGGKTRSGLAFALNHAVIHGLRRIVVALPYTSIIEQTAREFREMLGADAVLEHHSALDIPDHDDEDEAWQRHRLATENWDTPVIVTTTVQLFESLFGDRASKVRKLHRLAKSVIILDEVQTFPPELLRPTLDVLRRLALPVGEGGYGSTVLLSTATQPAFEAGPFADLLAEVEIKEIVPNYAEHYEAYRRVNYERRSTPLTWAELAEVVSGHAQALVVLNTRKDALALLEAVGSDENTFHLSTLLCGAHRRDVLAEINERLERDEPVRLISTQVIECGVDIDFPIAYRALGPLDRIVQVAGRCNRHGNRPTGTVTIFTPAEGGMPRGPYKDGFETARLLLEMHPPEALHDPDLYREFFQRLFQKVDPRLGRKIQEYRGALNYPDVAKNYRLIPEETIPVVVPYGEEWRDRLNGWLEAPSRRSWQRLQPYLVNIYKSDITSMGTWLEQVSEGLYRCLEFGYDAKGHRGLMGAVPDPSDLIV